MKLASNKNLFDLIVDDIQRTKKYDEKTCPRQDEEILQMFYRYNWNVLGIGIDSDDFDEKNESIE